MKVLFGVRDLFVHLGFGILLLGAAGCEGNHSSVKIEPDGSARVEPNYSPPHQRVDDLKKDIKPPVIVKPSPPAGDAAIPTSPKRESR